MQESTQTIELEGQQHFRVLRNPRKEWFELVFTEKCLTNKRIKKRNKNKKVLPFYHVLHHL